MAASIADYQNATPKSALNLSVATLVKATAGVVLGLALLSGTAPGGTINDCTSVGAVAASNQVCQIPSGATAPTEAVFNFQAYCLQGIVVTPPPGGTVSVFFA